MASILVLNGPNLNLVGTRQPEIYGSETLADAEAACRALLPADWDMRFLQSNHEGQLVDWIHEARREAVGIAINAAAYTHTSIAIMDALHAFEGPVVEVHISHVHRRESFRHWSYVSQRADGFVAGLGLEGYEVAVRHIIRKTS